MTIEELWQLFPIILKEHTPQYKDWYLEENENITSVVGKSNFIRINHIGSTAVEGLLAKPIVDILLEVLDSCDIEDLKNKLQNDGWILMTEKYSPELKLSFNKGYTPDGFAEKVFHLHVRYFGDWGELYFRDYLNKYPQIANEYAQLKLTLKEKFEHDRDAYTDAKTVFVDKYTQIARKEFENKYKPVLNKKTF